jgi:GWxTD domain-containing protein
VSRTPRRWPLTFALAATLATPGQAAKDVNLKAWITGPVRYIAEAEEAKVYKRLKTDEDRALFIERFWARRDPTPETLANEYRQLFWERVQESKALFLDSHKTGWMTDRGKVYILYGPPTRIEDHFDLDTQSDPTAGRGLIRWHYEGRPSGRMDMDPVVIVPFLRQSTGEYTLSYDPKLSSVFFDALAVEEQWDRAIDRYMEILGAPRATEMSVMLDLGRMQEVPPQSRVLMERIETIESYRTHPVEIGISRYVHPDGEGVVVVVTADVSTVEQDVNPAVLTRFTPHDASRPPRMLGEDSFRMAATEHAGVAQGRILMDPGSYDVTVLVADPTTATTGMHRQTIHVPEESERLRLSDVTWADELHSLEYASLASHDEPYHVGPFRVVPRLNSRFLRGSSLQLFYEIYGGTPPYRISYQIEGRDLDGSWVELGRPATGEQALPSQGWGIPTSAGWPLGDYRVRIEVEDSQDRLMTTYQEFELAETAAEVTDAEAGPDIVP